MIHRDKGKARRYSDADIACMEEMLKTMTQAEVGAAYGVSRAVIEKQINEHGTPKEKVYKPRVLRQWPRTTNFRHDNIAVRD
jgi:hypothetical protein